MGPGFRRGAEERGETMPEIFDYIVAGAGSAVLIVAAGAAAIVLVHHAASSAAPRPSAPSLLA